MDSLITASAIALANGDALGALKRLGLREDAPALALRGIAMAQLGDLERARIALKKAARTFGSRETVARARCVVAQAELALVSRDLGGPAHTLDEALATLEAHGDRLNAAHARIVAARRLLLIGSLGEAERMLGPIDRESLPPTLVAARSLVAAGIAIRRLETAPARLAIDRARHAARQANLPALTAEVEGAGRVLREPAARLIGRSGERPLLLGEVESVLKSSALVINACRGMVRAGDTIVPLASRPVLFALARALGEAWPGDVARRVLIARAFHGREADESHRARLRVEIGRLRAELSPLVEVKATKAGFALSPYEGRNVIVLAPPLEDGNAALLALLADGEAWASSALALALGIGPRTVQRALEELARAGKVESTGQGRARRWLTPPVPGFPTTLLLPVRALTG